MLVFNYLIFSWLIGLEDSSSSSAEVTIKLFLKIISSTFLAAVARVDYLKIVEIVRFLMELERLLLLGSLDFKRLLSKATAPSLILDFDLFFKITFPEEIYY